MARHETGFTPTEGNTEAEDPSQHATTAWQGFPKSAVHDKPGYERQYTLDRIERTIGSIL